MKVVIAGGSGQIGQGLAAARRALGDEVTLLSRHAGEGRSKWDGVHPGPWEEVIDGSDVVINLAGRTVNCRYGKTNLAQMLASRVDSTTAIGRAIDKAERPPRLWLQMSTATIYAHTFGPGHDEESGVLGGYEPDAPEYWRYSVEIGRAWERAMADAHTPDTRRVAMRSGMVMAPRPGGILATLMNLTRVGLGGSIGGGQQYMSWIHEGDFVRAIDFLIEHDELEGVFNLTGPAPIAQRDFARSLREALQIPIGMPATRWMIRVGAFFLGTDPELVLKSRRVLPRRLLDKGFRFDHPTWEEACIDLVQRRGDWRYDDRTAAFA